MKTRTLRGSLRISGFAALVVAVVLMCAPAVAGAAPKPKPSPSPTGTPPPSSGTQWSVMVYCDGDNNLESYLVSDIDTEFGLTGADANIAVSVLADRVAGFNNGDGDWTGTKLFYCTPGTTALPQNAVADWGERNMGDKQTLIDFITWTKANHPGARYLLVLWDHGYTWWPAWTMWDETSQDALDLSEMAAAATATGGVDVVTYDCCASATAEVSQTWRPYAKYTVASEDYTYAEGAAWETIIPAMKADPTMDAATLATTIGRNMNDGTTSVTALDSRWDTLRTAVDQWAVALRNGLPANLAAYDAARKVTKYFCADTTLCDLYGAAANIQSRVTDPTVKAACQNVMNAVKGCVVYESHKTKYAGANGLTIWWPKTVADLAAADYGGVVAWPFYRALPWSTQTAWDEFLAAYVR